MHITLAKYKPKYVDIFNLWCEKKDPSWKERYGGSVQIRFHTCLHATKEVYIFPVCIYVYSIHSMETNLYRMLSTDNMDGATQYILLQQQDLIDARWCIQFQTFTLKTDSNLWFEMIKKSTGWRIELSQIRITPSWIQMTIWSISFINVVRLYRSYNSDKNS